jgi:hypothetical protein
MHPVSSGDRPVPVACVRSGSPPGSLMVTRALSTADDHDQEAGESRGVMCTNLCTRLPRMGCER